MRNLIIKDNALIEASHKLGETEQRLILLAILKAREECKKIEQLKDKELTISARDYITAFGVDRDVAYKSLKKAVMGLYRAEWGYKYINEKGNIAVRYERFTQSAEYVSNEGLVRFTFASAIIPFLVELEKRFTVYEIEQVAQLSSSYSMRLYEFFMQHFDKNIGRGWLEISLEDLRFRLGLLPIEYLAMCDFKKRILDYSINEINAKTDLIASYEQRKKGRVITGFRFDFKRKKKQSAPKEEPKFTKPDLFAEFTEIERKTIQERIEEHIKRLEQKGDLVGDFHRANITKKAIDERWGLDVLAKKQAKEQAEKERREQELAKQKAEQEAKKHAEIELGNRINAMVATFESLEYEEQQAIYEEIANSISVPLRKMFFEKCRNGTAYKKGLFVQYFLDLLGF